MAFEGEDARRWALVDAPPLQPGVDFITKSPNGPFIDTGLNVSFEMRGRVYLSVDTIREMAEVAGLLESKDATQKNLYDIEMYNKGYEAGLKEGAELIGKLDSVIGHLRPDTGWLKPARLALDAGDAGDAADEPRVPKRNPRNVQGTPARSGKSGGKASAAGSSGGPDDLSGFGDDDEQFRI